MQGIFIILTKFNDTYTKFQPAVKVLTNLPTRRKNLWFLHG